MGKSLRRQLLAWVLVPLVTAVAVDAWLSYQSALGTASVVQDRLLLGSARMIAEQIRFEDGSFNHQIPPAALELFQSEDADSIFYRVTTGAGKLLAGYTELPIPAQTIPTNTPYFFASTMRAKPVRAVAFFQPVIGNPSALPVIVEVAQTLRAHESLTHKLWLQSVWQQLLILALTTIFILFGLHRGLQPLIWLRNEVRSRKEGSLQLLQTQNIPTELKPLVETFNDYIQRLEGYTILRGNFIQDAAHQLRTPLAVLHTHVSDALRADSKANAEISMLAAHKTLQQTTRLVNQFLTLSSAEAYAVSHLPMSTQACCDVVQSVLEDLVLFAHAKDIDLGFERTGDATMVSADAIALREIAVNLIDNAIRYTAADGVVTVKIHSAPDKLTLQVEDNGPGIPVDQLDKVFARFYRINETVTTGSGLGLAIVKELVAQCAATVKLASPSHGGRGLAVVVEFPRL